MKNTVLSFILFSLCATIFSGCTIWDVEELMEKSRPKSKDKDTAYTVKYNGNGSTGGTVPVDGKTYQSGAAVTVLGNTGNLVKTGYNFKGWNVTANGTSMSYEAGNKFPIKDNIVLYAYWVPLNANTVTFNSNGGSATANQYIASGGRAIRPANPTRSGYVFVGWYSNSGLTVLYNFSAAVNSNITLYAKWFEGTVSDSGIELVSVRAGAFTMGSPANEPDRNGFETRHHVTLTGGFYMGKYTVTQAQYMAVMNNVNLSSFKGDNLPVDTVSWYDAIVFCNRLSLKEKLTPAYSINGSADPNAWGTVPTSSNATWNAVTIVAGSTGYRLPTEAQWEYACRAGTETAFNWGSSNIDSGQANYNASIIDGNNTTEGTNLKRTTDVGSYAPNAWGLYDMHGNIREWCWDRWDGLGDYSNESQTDPAGASSGSYRILRGGSWDTGGEALRSAWRHGYYPYSRNWAYSFRVVRPDDGNIHTHTYSTTWSSNATQHWRECAFAGCDAKTGTANHSPANGICSTCGYGSNIPIVMEMVSIPAGTFKMGPEYSGGPTMSVTLSAFKMGKYEVTQEQYQEVMGTNPSYFSSNPAAGETQSKRPVEYVTWYDAIEFCNKQSVKEGLTPVYTITGRTPATGYPITGATVTANWRNNGYRLPTEAQWEYACRAGSTTDWYFGNTEANLKNYAWYSENASYMTHQVGKKTANAWGLYDMHGNVWEWCWDWYSWLYYEESGYVQSNPIGPTYGDYRVSRGGDWNYWAEYTRSAYRSYYSNPYARDSNVGFRVVLPSWVSAERCVCTGCDLQGYKITEVHDSPTPRHCSCAVFPAVCEEECSVCGEFPPPNVPYPVTPNSNYFVNLYRMETKTPTASSTEFTIDLTDAFPADFDIMNYGSFTFTAKFYEPNGDEIVPSWDNDVRANWRFADDFGHLGTGSWNYNFGLQSSNIVLNFDVKPTKLQLLPQNPAYFVEVTGITFHWTDQQTVSFDLNGGSVVGGGSSAPVIVRKGFGLDAKLPDVEKTGWFFIAWEDSSGNVYGSSTPINSNVTLKAIWADSEPVYVASITVLHNGHGVYAFDLPNNVTFADVASVSFKALSNTEWASNGNRGHLIQIPMNISPSVAGIFDIGSLGTWADVATRPFSGNTMAQIWGDGYKLGTWKKFNWTIAPNANGVPAATTNTTINLGVGFAVNNGNINYLIKDVELVLSSAKASEVGYDTIPAKELDGVSIKWVWIHTSSGAYPVATRVFVADLYEDE